MAHTINVDDEVYATLEGLATVFVDSPNSVLRRVLGLARKEPDAVLTSANETKRLSGRSRVTTKRSPSKRTRLAKGELLPESEYELPILQALIARGGSAPAADVIEDVGQQLTDRLTPVDLTINESGLVRWKSRTQFARLNLVKAGELEKDSPRGTWRISQAGERRLARAQAEA